MILGSLSGEYDYDYYGNSEEFRTLTEDAIQTLLLSNNKDIAAINDELTSGTINNFLNQKGECRRNGGFHRDILEPIHYNLFGHKSASSIRIN